MPLYEYICPHCGRRFDVRQGFNDPPVENCPVCKHTVKRVLGHPAIHFKGSGFYVTDNKASSHSRGD
ncbi:MAG: zinc ribbon domain-containing protein [Anaerolineales bacterium]|nr:zinc ribbon domain-containing protein [Anaerolineales bacterium]